MSACPGRILLAEDDRHDQELILRALKEHRIDNEVVVVDDGAKALDYLHRRGEYASVPPGNPALVLLDIKMPKVDGLEVLREVRATEELRMLPVVMLTSSREHQDINESYTRGTSAYVVKPVDYTDFVSAIGKIGAFWGLLNEPPPGTVVR